MTNRSERTPHVNAGDLKGIMINEGSRTSLAQRNNTQANQSPARGHNRYYTEMDASDITPLGPHVDQVQQEMIRNLPKPNTQATTNQDSPAASLAVR